MYVILYSLYNQHCFATSYEFCGQLYDNNKLF